MVSSTTGRQQVTIPGRVRGRSARPPRMIVERRVSCGRYRVIKRFKPPRDGTFRSRVAGRRTPSAAAYRLGTQVRKFTRNPKPSPTFTLPRSVDLRRP